jgi:23S rRNA pseudouridine2605 synthase
MSERLQKILRAWGVASRRQAEQLILAGQVRVNGDVAHLGQCADPDFDRIEVAGELLRPKSRPDLIYLLLNKPRGVVCTCTDPRGRRTVLDCLPEDWREGLGLHPVGRLDVDSTGAIVVTNDGDLTFGLTHPSHEISKTYEVLVEGHPPEARLQNWRRGVMLEGRKTLPAIVRTLSAGSHQTWLEVILREGRNRQIRKVAAQLGHPVIRLHRTAIGDIYLQSPSQSPMASGSYRPLTDSEITFLKSKLH